MNTIVDLNKYRTVLKPQLKAWIDYKQPDDLQRELSLFAAVTGFPLLELCYYTGELYGFSFELLAMITSLKKFYQVEQVIGEESPLDAQCR
jgi:hypothetical protein